MKFIFVPFKNKHNINLLKLYYLNEREEVELNQ